jgi:hypothetical protein
MGFRDRLTKFFDVAGGEPHADGLGELHVGDASYDDWDVVADYPELETARAFHQALAEQGITAVLTSDWPLDEWGRGDIALRVPAGQGADAEELLDSD